LLIQLRKVVAERLPRVELAELVLEVALRTGFTQAFTHLTDRSARTADFALSLCAALLAEACNTGPEPFIRHDTPALRRDRIAWVKQNYLRDETISAGNATLVAAQNRIALAHAWGGGEIASADGMRFVVPIRTVHAGLNPKYFGPLRGMTWYNLLSDQFTGLNAIPVPGTLRDSLVLLAVVLEQQTELKPTRIMIPARIAMSCSACSDTSAIASVRAWPTSAARASGASIRGPTTANSMSFPSTDSSCSASHHIGTTCSDSAVRSC